MMADIQTTSLLFIVVIVMPNNVRLQRVVRSKQEYHGKTMDSARRNCSCGIPWHGDNI